MADDVLTLIISARDMASATLARTSKELRMMGPAAGVAAGPMAKLSAVTGGLISPATLAIGAVAGLTAGAFAAADAAREDETSIALLGQALKANVKDYDGNTTAIEAAITARMKLGFADETQRASLRLLVAVTKDSAKALDLQRLAMDFARLKNIDLATASQLVGKVYGGNIGILSRYGIQLEKGTTSTEALAELQKRAAGQAEEWADTSEGAAETAGIAFGELVEQVGYGLLPVMTELARFARDDLVPALKAVVDAAGLIGDAIGIVTGAADELGVQDFGAGGIYKAAEAAHVAAEAGTGMTATWVRAWGAMTPPKDISDTIAGPVQDAANEARRIARREFGRLPDDISDAVKNNLPDINDGLDALKDMFKTSLSDAEKIAKLEGILASKALAKGLRDERFDVRAAAREVQREAQTELALLESGAKDAAADGGATYAEFLRKQKGKIGAAAKEAAEAAEFALAINTGNAGATVVSTYIDGIARELIASIPIVNNAAYRFMQATLGTSLPKSGPFAHPEKGAISIVDKFTDTISDRLKNGMGNVQAGIPSLSASYTGVPVRAGVGDGRSLTINVNLPPTAVPYSPAQLDDVARVLIPAIMREQQRQGF